MSVILKNDNSISIEYNEKEDMIVSKLKRIETAEDFIRGIKKYKEIFEKIYPTKGVWDHTDFSLVLSDELQKWVYNFLDKPVSNIGHVISLAHVVPPDVLTQLSITDIYSKNSPLVYRPHYFSHVNQAFQYMTQPQVPVDDIQLNIEQNNESQRVKITLDIPLDKLPDYLGEFRRMLTNRTFLLEKMHLYQTLSYREKEILTYITRIHSNHEIADRLYLSVDTVKTHRKNIARKLACKHPSELMMYRVFG